MSLLLQRSRHSAARLALSRNVRPLQAAGTSSIHRRTIFGVGDPVTYATIAACKNLLWGTIGLNGAVFGAWLWSSQRGRSSMRQANSPPSIQQRVERGLNTNFLLKADDIPKGRWWTLLTSAFSHREPYHILGNMFALHAFSSVLIYSGVPPVALGVLMLGSAISGSIGFLAHERSQARGAPSYFNVQHAALGASGMVMGLGASAAMLAPTANMLLFGIVPVPMWALFAGYTVYDTYYLDNPASRTGHAAHLGGGAFGAIFYTLVLRRLGGIF